MSMLENPWGILIILIILVIVFGASRLSTVGGAVGKSIREFRSAVHEEPAAIAAPSTAPESVPALPEVACPSCQALNAVSQKFCGKCGARMASPVSVSSATLIENTCPSCATVNPPGQAFCGQCGTRLSRAA
jgi:sec-independent protein translocase protein TatA